MCDGNMECIYDATVTGNMDIGLETMEISMANDQSLEILGEFCWECVYICNGQSLGEFIFSRGGGGGL